MARRCCCGLESCTIYYDDFNRVDNDDPGSGWNEVDDDWDIESNALVERGNFESRIVCTTPNPRSGRGHVNTAIYPVDGDKYGLILNSDANASVGNYLYVEAQCNTGSLVLIAGGETRTYTSADGWDITARPMTLQGCVDNGLLWVQVTHLGFGGRVWDTNSSFDNSRRYAGLINRGSSEITYDPFTYYHHIRDGLISPPCIDCSCHCTADDGSWWYIPWKLRLTFYSDDCPGGCCCFDGGWADLEYDVEAGGWLAVDGLVCGHTMPYADGPPAYNGFPQIVCGDDERCDWLMWMWECCAANAPGPDCPTLNIDPCAELGADLFSCDPFAVRWNFPVPFGDLVCEHCGGMNPGTYYAILTEMP